MSTKPQNTVVPVTVTGSLIPITTVTVTTIIDVCADTGTRRSGETSIIGSISPTGNGSPSTDSSGSDASVASPSVKAPIASSPSNVHSDPSKVMPISQSSKTSLDGIGSSSISENIQATHPEVTATEPDPSPSLPTPTSSNATSCTSINSRWVECMELDTITSTVTVSGQPRSLGAPFSSSSPVQSLSSSASFDVAGVAHATLPLVMHENYTATPTLVPQRDKVGSGNLALVRGEHGIPHVLLSLLAMTLVVTVLFEKSIRRILRGMTGETAR